MTVHQQAVVTLQASHVGKVWYGPKNAVACQEALFFYVLNFESEKKIWKSLQPLTIWHAFTSGTWLGASNDPVTLLFSFLISAFSSIWLKVQAGVLWANTVKCWGTASCWNGSNVCRLFLSVPAWSLKKKQGTCSAPSADSGDHCPNIQARPVTGG